MEYGLRHIVAFSLKHEKGSAGASKFLDDSMRILGPIPHVARFEQFSQVSPKNDFDYVFVFDFKNEADFAAYCEYPAHVDYVRDIWDAEVADFMETDIIGL